MRKIENYKIVKIVIGRVRNGLSYLAKPIALSCRWLAMYYLRVTKYRRHGRSWKSSHRQAEIAQLGERQTEDLKVPGSTPGLGISENIAPFLCVSQNVWSCTLLYVLIVSTPMDRRKPLIHRGGRLAKKRRTCETNLIIAKQHPADAPAASSRL